MRNLFRKEAIEFFQDRRRWPTREEIAALSESATWGKAGLTVEILAVDRDQMALRFKWKTENSRFEGWVKQYAITAGDKK